MLVVVGLDEALGRVPEKSRVKNIDESVNNTLQM